jgi:hypothetical protein
MSDGLIRGKNGQFIAGSKPPGGRPLGSRNRLAENFVSDLKDAWAVYGPAALARCAQDEPAQFVKVVASLMPRDIRIDALVTVEPGEFVDRFRQAQALLGNGPKVIEHAE